MPIEDRFSRIHMDILGPLTKTTEGHKYMLLVVDSFSKWPEGFPLRTKDSTEIAKVLFKEIWCTIYHRHRPRTKFYDQACNSRLSDFPSNETFHQLISSPNKRHLWTDEQYHCTMSTYHTLINIKQTGTTFYLVSWWQSVWAHPPNHRILPHTKFCLEKKCIFHLTPLLYPKME